MDQDDQLENQQGKAANLTKGKLARARARRSTIKGPNLDLHVNPSSMFEIKVFSNDDVKANAKLQKAVIRKASELKPPSKKGGKRASVDSKKKTKLGAATQKESPVIAKVSPRSPVKSAPEIKPPASKEKVREPPASAPVPETKQALPVESKLLQSILKSRLEQTTPPDVDVRRRSSGRITANEDFNEDDYTAERRFVPGKRFRGVFCPSMGLPPRRLSSRGSFGRNSEAGEGAYEYLGEDEMDGEGMEELGEFRAEDEIERDADRGRYYFLERLVSAEEFEEYLRESGLWAVLSRCFISLYMEYDRPEYPIDYFVDKMTIDVPTKTDIEMAYLDIEKLEQRVLDLKEQHQELLDQIALANSAAEENMGEFEGEDEENEH